MLRHVEKFWVPQLPTEAYVYHGLYKVLNNDNQFPSFFIGFADRGQRNTGILIEKTGEFDDDRLTQPVRLKILDHGIPLVEMPPTHCDIYDSQFAQSTSSKILLNLETKMWLGVGNNEQLDVWKSGYLTELNELFAALTSPTNNFVKFNFYLQDTARGNGIAAGLELELYPEGNQKSRFGIVWNSTEIGRANFTAKRIASTIVASSAPAK